MTKFRDIAHFYLGCELLIPPTKSIIKMEGLINEMVHFRIRGIWHSELIMFYKPILRPLSNMTEDELNECGNIDYDFSDDPELGVHKWEEFTVHLSANQFEYLLKKAFDLFDLIPNGEALDKTKLQINENTKTIS